MTRKRRRLLEAIVWLVAGALVSVLLAWLRSGATGIFPEAQVQENLDLGRDPAWVDARLDRAAAMLNEPDLRDRWFRMKGFRLTCSTPGERVTTMVLRLRPTAPWISDEDTLEVRVIERGWPFTCLGCSEWTLPVARATGTPAVCVLGGWRVAEGAKGRAIVIPWTPTWGLAFDSLFFALLFWLLARAPRLLQQAWWRRHGECPRCGHPRRGAAICPECGAG